MLSTHHCTFAQTGDHDRASTSTFKHLPKHPEWNPNSTQTSTPAVSSPPDTSLPLPSQLFTKYRKLTPSQVLIFRSQSSRYPRSGTHSMYNPRLQSHFSPCIAGLQLRVIPSIPSKNSGIRIVCRARFHAVCL